MEGTKILKCTCTHEQQDEMYGRGYRVHNAGGKKGNDEILYYCTVCAPRCTNKVKTTIAPAPALGMMYAIQGCGTRVGKRA